MDLSGQAEGPTWVHEGDPQAGGPEAKENSTWGYRRIQGALRNLGHRVARSTIAKVLKEHGMKPSPDRPSSWKTFMKAHWGEVVGMDFFTAEVWTARGLVTYYVLFLIDLRSRQARTLDIQLGKPPRG